MGVGVQALGSGAPEARVFDHARYMHGRDTNMRQCDMVLAVGAHGWTACRKWKHQKTFEIFFFSIFSLGHTKTRQPLQTTANFSVPSGRDLSALFGSEKSSTGALALSLSAYPVGLGRDQSLPVIAQLPDREISTKPKEQKIGRAEAYHQLTTAAKTHATNTWLSRAHLALPRGAKP